MRAIRKEDAHGFHFDSWLSYHGLLAEGEDKCQITGKMLSSELYGFESISNPTKTGAFVPSGGAVFGFVIEGQAKVQDAGRVGGSPADDGILLTKGWWFALPDGCDMVMGRDTRVVVTRRLNFHGLRAFGGPIEATGRLRYIDRCSDTLLMGPPLLGDPCLNHLHFPPGIAQTQHTHPSLRAGAVVRGHGQCETPEGLSELLPGTVFHIPANGAHRFITHKSAMDVVAYHPDSDWGPTDQNHPMLNRTWVDGKKMDNSTGVHAEADVIGR